jgi:hypothetical protein
MLVPGQRARYIGNRLQAAVSSIRLGNIRIGGLLPRIEALRDSQAKTGKGKENRISMFVESASF